MRPTGFIIRLTCLSILLLHGSCLAMTVDLGSGGGDLISVGESWRFLAGHEAPSAPASAWTEPDFDDSDWTAGPSGFGYGDGDDATVLNDMRNNYVTVYLRRAFSASDLPPEAIVELVIDYDDGFVAYLNGQEVERRSMPNGPIAFDTRASSHEAGTPEIYKLGSVAEVLTDGANVLAIEGHNTSIGSSDFSLIPSLRIAGDTVKNGSAWIVETQTVTVRGRTDAVGVNSVTINGLDVDFSPADGTWTGQIVLTPGWNLFTAISYGTIEIVNDEDGLAIHYALSFTQLYIIVVAIGLLIAVGGAAHGESPRSTITFAALGCLWLGGMNVVIAKARFAKLMRRCIQEACSELGEQNNK